MQDQKHGLTRRTAGLSLILGTVGILSSPINFLSAQEKSKVKEDSFDPRHYWYGSTEYNLMDPSQFKQVLTTQFREYREANRSVGLRLLVEENEKKFIVPADDQLRRLIDDCNSGYNSLRKKSEQAKANPKDPKLEPYRKIIVHPDIEIVKGNISVGSLREVIDQELTTFNFDPNDNREFIRKREKWYGALVEKQRESLPRGLVEAIDNYGNISDEVALTRKEKFFRENKSPLFFGFYVLDPAFPEYWEESLAVRLPVDEDLVRLFRSEFSPSGNEIVRMHSSALTMAKIEPEGIEGLIRSSPTRIGSKEITVFDDRGNFKGVIYLGGRVVKIN